MCEDKELIEYDSQELLIQSLERLLLDSSGVHAKYIYHRKILMHSAAVWSVRTIKRLIDITSSLLALIALSPLFLVVGVIIKLTDPSGSVFYLQKRVGKWGREFDFPKFRSMVANADKIKDQLLKDNQHGDSLTFKMKNDPRVTAIGRFIRRFSIDELPQLWCVLKGDMSLVGPRPALPREVINYNFAQRRRLDCAPGLTCIWQVSGRGDIPFEEQAKLDKRYIESRSLLLDIKLILQTIPAVITGRGAY